MAFLTIPDLFYSITDRHITDERPVYKRKVAGKYEGYSYAQLRSDVEKFALGLVELGFEKGDRLGIVSENRVEWIVTDFACAILGVVDVPVFPTLTHEQIEYIFNNCSARGVVVSNAFQLGKVLRAQENIQSLEHIIVLNNDVTSDSPLVKSFSDVLALGSTYSSEDRHAELKRRSTAVSEDDLLTLIYTSGTTGEPKGVQLTHKNICSNINDVLDLLAVSNSDVFLSFLPMCHSFERIGGYYVAFAAGATTAFAESIETVAENLREVKPTIMTSVPRLFERIRGRVVQAMERESDVKKKIFRWACDVGMKWVRMKESGKVSVAVSLQRAIADKLVFSKIRARTGGNIRFFVSGGAALPFDVGAFFAMMGMPIVEGYGLTETSPVLTVPQLDQIEIGTVGKPIAHVTLKLAEDGEILAKGPNVMSGYWLNETATRESFDADGWFKTGDIGEFTAKGNLKITDRKKNLLVASNGKNIAPQHIEDAIKSSRFVDQVLLIGDNRPFCTAIVVVDVEQTKVLAREMSITISGESDLIENQQINQVFRREIDGATSGVAKYERVRRFHLTTTPFSVENGMMTPTLKVRRKIVERHFVDEINAMYQEFNDREA